MKINYGGQKIDDKDIKAVAASLKNKLLTTGKIVESFESSLKKYVNTKNVITCNSGTSAIFLSLLALNLRKNANVIIPAINFVAAANLSNHLGYNVYFSDIELSTGQISSNKIFECIKKNKLKKIDLVFTMHLGGNPENVIEIFNLKKKLNFFIIEDACHSFGSSYSYNKKKFNVGNAKHSDVTTFSFHPLKTITTGEGGAITSQNSYLAKKIRQLRSHGMINKKGIDYDINSSGFNFRLSDINCALGLSQLKKIKKILSYRRDLFKYYLKNLDGYKNVVNFLNKNYKNSSCHLAIVKINFEKLNISKKQFYKLLKNKGIICQFHYIPQYNFTLFKKKEKLKNSQLYFYNYISLPIHLMIGDKEIRYIVREIKNIIDQKLLKLLK